MQPTKKRSIVIDFIKAGYNLSPDALSYLAERQDPAKFSKLLLTSIGKDKSGITITKNTLIDFSQLLGGEECPPAVTAGKGSPSVESPYSADVTSSTKEMVGKVTKTIKGGFEGIDGTPPERSIKDAGASIPGNENCSINDEDQEKFQATGYSNHAPTEIHRTGPTNEDTITSQQHGTQVTSMLEKGNAETIPRTPVRSLTSKSTFIALASEYDARIKVVEDCTGDLKNEGGFKDFHNLFLDREEKLRKMFLKKREIHRLLDIGDLSRLSAAKQDSYIAGMVVDKRTTKKGNYMIEIEDHTGSINAILSARSISEDTIMNILLDEVIAFKGYYSGDEKSGIFLANEVQWPGIRVNRNPAVPEEDISIMLLSDLHIGSNQFLESQWDRFVHWMNGDGSNRKHQEMAGKVKYVAIAGDIIDGIGVYPKQEEELTITSIYEQFETAARMLQELPSHVSIIISPGNHEPVRRALPSPAIPESYGSPLYDMGCTMVGNPALVSTHGIKTLLFHGDSFIDLSMDIPEVTNATPQIGMRKLIESRHLAPTFGRKTEIAPDKKDWLVIDQVPDIFLTGHVHCNGVERYKGVWLVNSGCFQAQTEFMKSLGINPTPGQPNLVNLHDLSLKTLNFSQ